MKDQVKIKGTVTLRLKDKFGKVIKEIIKCNTITTAGKNALVNWLTTYPHNTYFMKFIGVGTGTATATALQTEIGTRTEVVNSNPGSSNIWQVSTTIVTGNATGTLTEVGLFDQSAGGTMFSSSSINIVKGNDNSLEITWQITFS